MVEFTTKKKGEKNKVDYNNDGCQRYYITYALEGR